MYLFKKSEDIRLLRQELEAGHRNLEQIAQLRDECSQLSWTGGEKRDMKDIRPKSASLLPVAPPEGKRCSRPNSSLGHRIVVSWADKEIYEKHFAAPAFIEGMLYWCLS